MCSTQNTDTNSYGYYNFLAFFLWQRSITMLKAIRWYFGTGNQKVAKKIISWAEELIRERGLASVASILFFVLRLDWIDFNFSVKIQKVHISSHLYFRAKIWNISIAENYIINQEVACPKVMNVPTFLWPS